MRPYAYYLKYRGVLFALAIILVLLTVVAYGPMQLLKAQEEHCQSVASHAQMLQGMLENLRIQADEIDKKLKDDPKGYDSEHMGVVLQAFNKNYQELANIIQEDSSVSPVDDYCYNQPAKGIVKRMFCGSDFRKGLTCPLSDALVKNISTEMGIINENVKHMLETAVKINDDFRKKVLIDASFMAEMQQKYPGYSLPMNTPMPGGDDGDNSGISKRVGSWDTYTNETADPDMKFYLITVQANAPIVTSKGSPTPSLNIRCQKGRTDVYVEWGNFISTAPVKAVQKMDRDEAESLYWNVGISFYSTGKNHDESYRSTFSKSPVTLAKEMITKSNFILQLTPHEENTVAASFGLNGLAEAVKPIAEACKWPRNETINDLQP